MFAVWNATGFTKPRSTSVARGSITLLWHLFLPENNGTIHFIHSYSFDCWFFFFFSSYPLLNERWKEIIWCIILRLRWNISLSIVSGGKRRFWWKKRGTCGRHDVVGIQKYLQPVLLMPNWSPIWKRIFCDKHLCFFPRW